MTSMKYATIVMTTVAVAAVATLVAQSAQTPVFRGGANLVLVDAYPQRDGKIVEGLAAGDFQILEDGKPQAIESLEFVRIEPGAAESSRRDPNTTGEMNTMAADPHNRVFITFLDQLHTTVEGGHDLRRPLVDTLNRIVGPDDMFGVMTQNMRPQDLTLARRMLSVEEQLAKYWSWGQRQRITRDAEDLLETSLTNCFHLRVEKLAPHDIVPWLVDEGPVKRYLDDVVVERRREDRTLTALEALVAYLPRLRESRTVLMVLTDGWLLFGPNAALPNEPPRDLRFEGTLGPPPIGDTTQRMGRASLDYTEFPDCVRELNRVASLDNARRFRDLIAAANRANVSVYPVAGSQLAVFDGGGASERVILNGNGPTGASVLARDASRLRGRVDALRTIAENTDGIAIVDTNDLAKGLKRIVDDVSAYYLLGYYSTNAKADGRFRKIEVKVVPPALKDVKIHARRGYLSAKEGAAMTTGVASPSGPVVTPAPVDEALGPLARLRESADVFTRATVSASDVAVVVEIASRQIERSAWLQGGDVQVDLTDVAGGRVASGVAKIEPGTRGAMVRLPIAQARGPFRVNARVQSGGNVLEDRIETASIASALLGGALIYRATPSPRAALRPVADQQFRRTERVHLEWPIMKPLDQRTARVLDRRGQPLPVNVTLTEREVDGRMVVAADVLLAPLTAADYVVELVVGSGAETQRVLVGIRVVG